MENEKRKISKETDKNSERKKNPHEKHRQRMLATAKEDADFENMTDFQVVEFFLQSFIPQKDTNGIAHELLDKFYSIYGICTASFDELYAVKGMTVDAARFFGFVLSTARRAERSRTEHNKVVESVGQCIEMLRPYFMNKNYESFYIMTLDINDKVAGVNAISKGVANFTNVDINKVIARATSTHAVKVLLAHNHPGGNLSPSKDDIEVTAAIAITLNGIGKELTDHIIFSNDGYFSFYENGIMTQIYKQTDVFTGQSRAKEVSTRLFADKYVLEPRMIKAHYYDGNVYSPQIEDCQIEPSDCKDTNSATTSLANQAKDDVE